MYLGAPGGSVTPPPDGACGRIRAPARSESNFLRGVRPPATMEERARTWSSTEVLTTAFVGAFVAGVIAFLILPSLYVASLVFLIMFFLIFVPTGIAQYTRDTEGAAPPARDTHSPSDEVDGETTPSSVTGDPPP